MSWNNRIVKHHRKVSTFPGMDSGSENIGPQLDREFFGVHEIHYNKVGEATGMTCDSVIGYFESVEEMVASLELILNDIKTRPIFEVPESWGNEENTRVI